MASSNDYSKWEITNGTRLPVSNFTWHNDLHFYFVENVINYSFLRLDNIPSTFSSSTHSQMDTGFMLNLGCWQWEWRYVLGVLASFPLISSRSGIAESPGRWWWQLYNSIHMLRTSEFCSLSSWTVLPKKKRGGGRDAIINEWRLKGQEIGVVGCTSRCFWGCLGDTLCRYLGLSKFFCLVFLL